MDHFIRENFEAMSTQRGSPQHASLCPPYLCFQMPKSEYEIPRVSPYRLAAHLTSAFIIYSGLVWTALSVAMPTVPTPESALMAAARTSGRRIVVPLALLIGCTALSGAFVAGNDAVSARLPPSDVSMSPCSTAMRSGYIRGSQNPL